MKKISKAAILHWLVTPHASTPETGITINRITELVNAAGYEWNSYYVSRLVLSHEALFGKATNRDYSKSTRGSVCYYARSVGKI